MDTQAAGSMQAQAPTPTQELTPTQAQTPTPTPTPAPTQAPTPTSTQAPGPASTPSVLTLNLRAPLRPRDRNLAFVDLGPTTPTDASTPPRVSLTGTPDRRPYTSKSPTLVVLYASWCLPCAEELPEVLALARLLADNSKIKMIFVSSDEASGPQALLASFEDLLAKAGLNASDLPARLDLRADPQGGWFAALARSRAVAADPKSLPQLWLLDHKGRLRAHLGGSLTAEHTSTLVTLATSLSKEVR